MMPQTIRKITFQVADQSILLFRQRYGEANSLKTFLLVFVNRFKRNMWACGLICGAESFEIYLH